MTIFEGQTGGGMLRQRMLVVLSVVCMVFAGLVIPATVQIEPAFAVMNGQTTTDLIEFSSSCSDSRNCIVTVLRPDPDTDGVRCVETNPANPDFTGIPFTPFTNGEVAFDLLLSEGEGDKTVCCEFINTQGTISPPLCETIELAALPGDLDGDSDVDQDDLGIVVNCFGQFVADNPDCAIADVAPPPNGDGVINILDISFVGSNFTP